MKVVLCCPYCGNTDLIGTDSEYIYRCRCKNIDMKIDDLGFNTFHTPSDGLAPILESLNRELNYRDLYKKEIQRLNIDTDTGHGVAIIDETKGSAGVLVWDSSQGRWI